MAVTGKAGKTKVKIFSLSGLIFLFWSFLLHRKIHSYVIKGFARLSHCFTNAADTQNAAQKWRINIWITSRLDWIFSNWQAGQKM